MPGRPEVVIGVEVREEDLLELDEADVAAQELSLRPLGAVEQEPVTASPHERRGQSARFAVGMEPDVPRKTTSRSTAADCSRALKVTPFCGRYTENAATSGPTARPG